jgi:hypothetical protein
MRRLALEGPGLWTVQECRALAKTLAQEYRPRGAKWHVKQLAHGQEELPVYVVTRGGKLGIHSVADPTRAAEKADAMVHALNSLDAKMKERLLSAGSIPEV